MLLFKLILASLVFASTHADANDFTTNSTLTPATVCQIAVGRLGGTPARHSSLALYNIFHTYYQGLYRCSDYYPAKHEACATDLYNRTRDLDNFYETTVEDQISCYDENYKKCVEYDHRNFIDSLNDPAMIAALEICYNPDHVSICQDDLFCYYDLYDCKIGTDCFLDEGGLQCLQDCGYAQLAAVADEKCPEECNLLEVCQGGGFECVKRKGKCENFFRNYDKKNSKCVAYSYVLEDYS